jgi:hypothetical protein
MIGLIHPAIAWTLYLAVLAYLAIGSWRNRDRRER